MNIESLTADLLFESVTRPFLDDGYRHNKTGTDLQSIRNSPEQSGTIRNSLKVQL